MNLGAFSISLSVQDISASKHFYEKLGFSEVGGDLSQNWLIMRNRDTTIGLFQGMFEKNTLTFNPGWDKNANAVPEFDDVRKIQKSLKESGESMVSEVDETTSGPGSIVVLDPDGNPILIDQHV